MSNENKYEIVFLKLEELAKTEKQIFEESKQLKLEIELSNSVAEQLKVITEAKSSNESVGFYTGT